MADRPDRESTTSMPRWVKVFGIILIILILLFVILLVFDGDRHGPGRHGAAGGHMPSIELAMQQP